MTNTDIDTDPTDEGWGFEDDDTATAPVEEDEEVKPTRTRAQAAPKAKDDDDEDEPEERPKLSIQRGWGAAERVASESNGFATKFKLSEEAKIVKFLEDGPYASFRQHWIDRSGPGQRSYTCIADDPRGCPLCDAGHRASARYAFNVAVLAEDMEPVVNSFEVGARVFSQLKNYHNDKRTGPLSKNYWAINKSGRGSTAATNTNMIRERDLPEDWGLDPLTEDQIKVLTKKMYGPEIVQINSYRDLEKVAEEDLDN